MNFKKLTTLFFHVLAWASLLSIPLLFLRYRGEHFNNDYLRIPEFISYLFFIGFFYLNANYLIPTFLSRKKIVTYIFLVVVILLFIATINAFITHSYYHFHRSFTRAITFRMFTGIFILAISTAYRFINDNIKLERAQKEKENENLKTELTFLRSQVSPHFMFNVLNNMVALARKKSDRLEPMIIELSNLMRYMLYEADEEKVNIEKEIEYLKSYIDLQMLRFGDDVKINFNVQKSSADNLIEPMLLIPLVENAFKHGVGLIEHPEIDVQLTTNEKGIFMRVINKINKHTKEIKDKNSGIGLNNLKRRLNLLYPDKHELVISENNNQFIASLNLKLKEG